VLFPVLVSHKILLSECEERRRLTQTVNLSIEIPGGFPKILNMALRVFLPCTNDVLHDVAQTEIKILVADKIGNLDLAISVI